MTSATVTTVPQAHMAQSLKQPPLNCSSSSAAVVCDPAQQRPNTDRHRGARPRPCVHCQACVDSSAVNSCTRMVPCPTARSTLSNPVSALAPRTRQSAVKSQTAVPWLQLSRWPTPSPRCRMVQKQTTPFKRIQKRSRCADGPVYTPRQRTQQIKCHMPLMLELISFQHKTSGKCKLQQPQQQQHQTLLTPLLVNQAPSHTHPAAHAHQPSRLGRLLGALCLRRLR